MKTIVFFYSLTWKSTPCKMTFYMKLMTASCSMSNFLPIVIIFRQITYLICSDIMKYTLGIICLLNYNFYPFYIFTNIFFLNFSLLRKLVVHPPSNQCIGYTFLFATCHC